MAKPRVVFVLGGPGCGKGTQCERISGRLSYTHISAGDCLREERANPDSEFGPLIDKCIKEGAIVPVEITVALLKNRMGSSGSYLIDGFPRNEDNLRGWIDCVGNDVDVLFCLAFDCPEHVLEARLLKRGETSGRTDDNLESIKKRFAVFKNETKPVMEYFQKNGKLRKIDGNRSVEEVWADVQNVFQKVAPRRLSRDVCRTGTPVQYKTQCNPLGFGTLREPMVTSYQANFGATRSGPPSPIRSMQFNASTTRAVPSPNRQSDIRPSASPRRHSHPAEGFPSPFKIVLFGPPASGKGTAAAYLKEAFKLAHISTGDLLREEAKKSTRQAAQLRDTMAAGGLVSDDLVIGMLQRELESSQCQTLGWLLDGFPRTCQQAQKTFSSPKTYPHVVVVLDVEYDVLKERICNRRIDPVTRAVYNVSKDVIPPDIRARLIQRQDDTETALKCRVDTYKRNLSDILEFLEGLPGVLVFRVDAGHSSPDSVWDNIKQHLAASFTGSCQRRVGASGSDAVDVLVAEVDRLKMENTALRKMIPKKSLDVFDKSFASPVSDSTCTSVRSKANPFSPARGSAASISPSSRPARYGSSILGHTGQLLTTYAN